MISKYVNLILIQNSRVLELILEFKQQEINSSQKWKALMYLKPKLKKKFKRISLLKQCYYQ